METEMSSKYEAYPFELIQLNYSTYTVCFLSTCLHLKILPAALSAILPVLDFFRSHFSIESGLLGQPEATLIINSYQEFNRYDFKAACFAPLVIRNKKGSAQAFNFFGERALLPDLEIVDSPNTKTALVFIAK